MKTPRRKPTVRRPPQPNLNRRLKPSGKGRLRFQPGEKHALDDQIKEARNYRRLLDEQTSQLEQLLAALNLTSLREQAEAEDEALKRYLWEKYRRHKHRDHILATFLIARRKRRLERLQAAETALSLVKEFLTPDDTLLQELQQAIEQAEQRPPDEEEEPEESGINYRRIGDAGTTRARLAAFDEETKQMRSALTIATGWFRVYWIEKERLTPEARKYLKRKEPVPEDVAMYEAVIYGPYLHYRWREEGGDHAPIYTIQMNLIDSETPTEEDEGEEQRQPWPNL